MKIYEPRRPKQALNDEEIAAVIDRNTYGVLSLCGDEGMPYGVPLNYVYGDDGAFYFHCGKAGHKLALIDENPQASLTIVDRDVVVPEKFATDYISVIAFGRIERISDPGEIYRTIKLLAARLGDADEAAQDREIQGSLDALAMLRFVPEHITGKLGLFLRKRKEELF